MGSVGTRFGLKRRVLDEYAQPQAAGHVIEHMVMAVSQPSVADLQCDVAIPQMISRARQASRVVGLQSRDRFLRRSYLHDPAVVGKQEIAVAQYVTAFEQHADLLTARQACAKSAAAPRVEGQH